MNPTPPLPVRRIRRVGISALLALGGTLWILKPCPNSTPDDRGSGEPETRSPAVSAHPALQGLPATEQESLWTALDTARRNISALSEEEAAMPGNQGVSSFSYHPVQNISTRYTGDGVRFTLGSSDESQFGFDYDDGRAVSELTTQGIRAELRHGDGVTEWFENRREGIEHGFTLKDRPAASGEMVELNVILSGLQAVTTADPATLELHAPDGAPKLRYSGLKAWDADGKDLASNMTPTPQGIRIAVNDSGARYPLTVDPLITNLEQELGAPATGPGEAGDGFGVSVAVDGVYALVGADSDDTPAGKDAGSAYVFAREGSKWVFKSLLRPKTAAGGDAFGRAVALSNSGATALIGAPLDDFVGIVDSGCAYPFARSGNTWTEQATIAIEGRAKGDRFGEVLSLSGTTAAVGSTERSGQRGIVCVHVRSGSSWPLQRQLFPPDSVSQGVRFGRAISIDGNNLAVSALRAPGSKLNNGTVYLYTRSEGPWTEPTPLSITTNEDFGVAVALSGSNLLIGAGKGLEGPPAAAYFYTLSGGTWTQKAKIDSVITQASEAFARTVALSGNNAIIGDAQVQMNTGGGVRKGAAYPFTWNGTSLIKGTAVGPIGNDASGGIIPVAISGTVGVAAWTAGGTDAGKPAGTAEVFDISNGRWNRRAVLSAGDNALNNRFGYAVDIDGDTCAIGAATDTTATGSERGSTYLFIRSGTTWTQEAKLSPGGTQNNLHFGAAVALREGILIAGAPGEKNQTGAAFVYGRLNGQWNLHRIIEAEGGSTGLFGASIALASDAHTAVIGAPGLGDLEGRAYVFKRSDQLWTQQVMLQENPPLPASQFGFSVAIDGSAILIGAPGMNSDPGAAHVFSRNGAEWTHQASFHGNDDRRFGTAVALNGKFALIGAPGPEIPNPSVLVPPPVTSAAYLFARRGDTWRRVARFTPEHPESTYRFGQAVALKGDVALAGAYASGESFHGGVHVFAREGTTWIRQALLESGEKAGIPSFAASLALSGDSVIVGAPGKDTFDPIDKTITLDTGGVSIFRLSGTLLSGPDESLFLAFDADSSGGLSASEWLAIYAKPPARAKEKLFAKADSDASGEVSLVELIAGKSHPDLIWLLHGWRTRAAAFLDLDELPDGIITRDEVAAMWAPGTPAKSIDAFWSRSRAGSGMDLKEWVSAKILPNFSTYEAAKAARFERGEVATDLDADGNGSISREEFAALFPNGTPTKPIDAAWRAACATPRRGTPPTSIGIQDFVEAPQLPRLPD